jgi:GNAT superfamily N-acetyltransferase
MSTTSGRGVGGVPSGSRREYGDAIPIRPLPQSRPTHCLRGHQLDLGGMTATYNHLYRLHATLCEICRLLERDDTRRTLAEWAHLDAARHHADADTPAFGLALVAVPPPRNAHAGQIQLRLNGNTVAHALITLCGPCRRGILHYIHADQQYRRLGYGRTLAAAALARQPTYQWTAETTTDNPVGRAFWATTGLPRSRARDRCPHMPDTPQQVHDER